MKRIIENVKKKMERTNQRKDKTFSNQNDEFFKSVSNVRERLQQEIKCAMEIEVEEFFRTEKYER